MPVLGEDLVIGLVHEVGAILDERHVEISDMHRGTIGLPLVIEAREQIEYDS